MTQPAYTPREPQLQDADPYDDDEGDLFDIPNEAGDAASDARAETDIAAGRMVSNEAVMRWLASLATDKPLPRPKCGE